MEVANRETYVGYCHHHDEMVKARGVSVKAAIADKEMRFHELGLFYRQV